MPLFAKGKMEYRDDDIPVTRLHLYLFGLLQLKNGQRCHFSRPLPRLF